VLKGARAVRVHQVTEARQAVLVAEAMLRAAMESEGTSAC